jgi:predicted secreted acid phosphatase
MNEAQAVMDRDESTLDDAPKLPARGREQLKSSRRIRNDEKWKSLKDEIYRIYMTDDNTLQNTMNAIFEQHGFEARYLSLDSYTMLKPKANRHLQREKVEGQA